MGIFTFNDLLEHYPFRHIDRTKIDKIAAIDFQSNYVQLVGIITGIEIIGQRNTKRLIAYLEDDTGEIELVWFQGIQLDTKNFA